MIQVSKNWDIKSQKLRKKIYKLKKKQADFYR